jgi:hypothetical protein
MSALEHEYNDGRKNNMTVRDSGIRYHIPHYIILCARMVCVWGARLMWGVLGVALCTTPNKQ